MQKMKLKKRNFILLIIGLIIFICILIEVSYTFWIFKGGPLVPSSDEVKKCYKNHNYLLSDCLYSINNSSDSLVKGEDNNLRFIGSSPNNYLDLGEKYSSIIYRGYSLTNENDYKDFISMSDCLDENRKCILKYHENDPILWRIIGVYKINDLSYVKIIRDDSIGKYAWDSSISDVNGGYGVNEWSSSKLNNLLNGIFYNRDSGECIIGKENKSSECSFVNNGIDNSIKKYLYEASWNLGSIVDTDIKSLSNIDWYNKELGVNEKLCNGAYCNDEITRNNNYNSYIGLLNPSDYLFSTSCNENSMCAKNNWLVDGKNAFWTIMPSSSLSSNSYAIMYNPLNGFEATFTSSVADIYPVDYLKREVKIMGGFGTKERPYNIY